MDDYTKINTANFDSTFEKLETLSSSILGTYGIVLALIFIPALPALYFYFTIRYGKEDLPDNEEALIGKDNDGTELNQIDMNGLNPQ